MINSLLSQGEFCMFKYNHEKHCINVQHTYIPYNVLIGPLGRMTESVSLHVRNFYLQNNRDIIWYGVYLFA